LSENEETIVVKELASTLLQLSKNPYCEIPYNKMKVRGWVTHCLGKELDDMVLRLINSLALMQARKKVLEPKKVSGFV
jgi:hypothetical protein